MAWVLGLLQAAGEFIEAEHDSNGANEQVGNVAGAEEDAIPIVEERALGSKVLGIDLNLPIVEETSDVERVDLPDPALIDVNAPPMRKSGDLSIELVRPMFRKLQNEAAKELRVSQTTLKTWCRIKGIKRGPYRILTSMDGLARNVEVVAIAVGIASVAVGIGVPIFYETQIDSAVS
ncbi:protein disulfide-isomerase LQY1 [Carex littledalei]|uniref:Protein disulfide-isomerase LQY1 n=1 Tax=Carex littledalei TaxID=544730 RepID=A0A833QQW0_9POAL|nr:protein disulfide-isomerase LQY1 [Carex littledalei]